MTLTRRGLMLRLLWQQPHSNSRLWAWNDRRLYTQDATRTLAANQTWTSQKTRETFINFFKCCDHLFVPSSSVVPKKDEGTYFINAGMNQFKPLFLDTVDPQSDMASYRRVVNSQKCIRVGGKHNDLDDVGNDLYHHTFFEMLGNWSFGDYFKKEACTMAWDLLTNVYGLPQRHLYVTYFGGNEAAGVEPDLECRDIWLQIGLPPERVLPFGMRDNFWEMGETGPCGPCSELHYDHSHSCDASRLVNADSPQVIELWNIVFMQYNRLGDMSLRPLPRHHVDTGMGLERVTAVLQGTTSNYNTDLFQPLFDHIHRTCGAPVYQGHTSATDQAGINTAYRIIADHARMLTVAISDGLRPGRGGLDSKVRKIVHRCVKQAHRVLKAPPGVVGSLVPIVVESLGEAFPEIQRNSAETQAIINEEEDRYLHIIAEGSKALAKALNKYGPVSCLTGDQILELERGRFGVHVPVHILQDLAEDRGLSLNMQEYEGIVNSLKVTSSPDVAWDNMVLSQHDMAYLKDCGIACTKDADKYEYTIEDGTYEFPPLDGTVVALKHDGKFVDSISQGNRCGVLVDKTCFYAENGGQKSDSGRITTSEGCNIAVDEVQELQNYVLHIGQVQQGTFKVGNKVTLTVDKTVRQQCMNNHTATHVLNLSLNCILGNVQQRGSMVSPEKLTFDFSCSKSTISQQDLVAISKRADQVIKERQAVYMKEVPLAEVQQIRGLHTVNDVVYPTSVRVVSLGVPVNELLADPKSELGLQHSVELCGGTHVHNTGHLGALVVTNFLGMTQGTKRVIAVTGTPARQAIANGKRLRSQLDHLRQWTSTGQKRTLWVEEAQAIEKSLSGQDILLSKIDRDDIERALQSLQINVLSAEKNKSVKDNLRQALDQLVNSTRGQSAVVSEFQFEKARDMVAVLATTKPDMALVLLSPPSDNEKRKIIQGVIYIPQNFSRQITAMEVGAHMCSVIANGNHRPPKGKYANNSNIEIVTFSGEDSLQLIRAVHAGKSVLGLNS